MSFEGCACSGGTLDRFVRPSVMAVLARHPDGLHGYLVAQQLREVPVFSDCSPDTTGLYRVLKTMETEGFLTSDWDVEGSGPARRVYRLTEAGHGCLRHWVNTLRQYEKNLANTIVYIEESVEPEAAGVSGLSDS